MKRIEEYVDQVISYIVTDPYTLSRLSGDLRAHLYEAAQQSSVEEAIAKMGPPNEMAQELMSSLYQEKSDVVRELLKTKAELHRQRQSLSYEYKSKARIFGIPLVHIAIGFPVKVAKGVIAIGNISIGLISVGGLAIGGLCFGGVGLGLLSFSGIALALLLAIGGIAVGSLAIGGLAVGAIAFGGCAIASHIAMGGYASATVAVGGTAKGLYALSTGGTSFNPLQVSAQEVRQLLLQAYPQMRESYLRMLTVFFR